MTVPFFDARRQDDALTEEIKDAVARVLASGEYILGPEVQAFEDEIATWLGVRHAIGVASGTDALLVALKAAGVGPGDVVLTSPFTFFATASAIFMAGAVPAFADVDAATFNLDPEQVEAALTGRSTVMARLGLDHTRIKAIIPVHLYGQAAPVSSIEGLGAARGIAVIEDAAQALGATLDGTQAGSLGTLGCFSFFPTKNLGTAGDGGLVTTNDDAQAARVRAIRAHGSHRRYRHDVVGTNSRLDALHAAILRCKLPYVAGWIEKRRANAAYYDDHLGDVAGILTPAAMAGTRHTYNQYTLRVLDGHRDSLREHLTAAGVGTAVYYPGPVHLQPALDNAGYRAGDFPVAEAACDEVLSLPIYPELRDDERTRVVDRLLAALC